MTQNVDNLHERAGSTHVIHLHGELTKVRSSVDPDEIVSLDGWEQRLDATASDGSLFGAILCFLANPSLCSTERRKLQHVPI